MAKQPEIETLLVGYNEKHKLNKNFKSINDKFVEMLSRTTPTETPNFMETDLDLADANITNVNRLEVESLQIVDVSFTSLSDYYIYLLAQLNCDDPGSMITHDINGDPVCLDIGSNGQALKAGSTRPEWSTDTNTVGVTVQEDGVTVAENVTTINFLWTDVGFPDIATTPASNQVDIALDDVYASTITALWEDTSQGNTNINPDGPSAVAFTHSPTPSDEVVRLDLVNTVGISIPTADNQYYFIMEASAKLESSNMPDAGSWTQGVRFYDNTGNATPLTGNQITEPLGEIDFRTGTTPGGNLMTIYCGVPAGTQYIDVAKGDAFLFPLFVTTAIVDNRYRALVTSTAKEAGFLSPNDVAYPGGVFPSVTA